jgi:hypothetical protein
VSSLSSYGSRTELDSRADTTVLGKHCLVVSHINCTADVAAFMLDFGLAEKISIITGALAYDHPEGETFIIVVNQALSIPTLDDNLVCTNQCRMNDVIIDECPKYLSPNPTDDTHTLTCKSLSPCEASSRTSLRESRLHETLTSADTLNRLLTIPSGILMTNCLMTMRII